jgi:trehalose/maltose transport system permease protein
MTVLRGVMQATGIYALAALIVVYAAFPFYWAVVSSLKTGSALLTIEIWPAQPTLENYVALFRDQPFLRNIANSLLVAGGATTLALAISVMAAYALARLRFRGRRAILFSVLGASMFPQIAVLAGMFELVRLLGLYDALTGLVLANLLIVMPLTVWVVTAFMRDIAIELEEAAIIDGAGPLRMVLTVFVPLLAPSLAAAGLLAFISAWNEFLFALTFTLSPERRTVPVAIALISGSTAYELPWGRIMAASVIVTLPLVALALLFQRWIVSGLTAGAVKG